MLIVIDRNNTIFDNKRFIREPLDSLDEKLFFVLGITENNHVSPLRFTQAVRNFIDDEIVAVLEGGMHGTPRDDEGLGDEEADWDNDSERENHEADNVPESASSRFFIFHPYNITRIFIDTRKINCHNY